MKIVKAKLLEPHYRALVVHHEGAVEPFGYFLDGLRAISMRESMFGSVERQPLCPSCWRSRPKKIVHHPALSTELNL